MEEEGDAGGGRVRDRYQVSSEGAGWKEYADKDVVLRSMCDG